MGRSGFSREEYAWALDPIHQRHGYGPIVWGRAGASHVGTFEMADAEDDLLVEFQVKVNPMRADEPKHRSE